MSIARAIWLEPPEDFLEDRRRRGLDRWDEMWDGNLHMPPPPTFSHNRRQGLLHRFLEGAVEAGGMGLVVMGTGVRPPGSGLSNYRVPDISVVASQRVSIITDWIEGGPDLVVEVCSPGDETYDKMPFYTALETHELLVVHRDSGRPELYRLAGRHYVAVAPDADGWLMSDRFPVAFRQREGRLEGQDRRPPDSSIVSLEP